MSVAFVKFFLLDSAIGRQATIDCVARLDDLFLLDFVVVGALENLAYFKQVLIEFFRVGFEIDLFLIGFGRHLFETLHFHRVFDNDFFFYFLRFFNLFFYLFFFDFGRSFRLFFLGLLGFFGRSFGFLLGRDFLFGFRVLLRLHLFDILVFFLVCLLILEFLGVFVAIDFVFFKIHLTDAKEVRKLLVLHVHIRFALIVQTLEHHRVERHHTADSLCAFVVDIVVLDFVGRGKTCGLLISFDKLPKCKRLLEIRLFQNDVRTHNRRTDRCGIAHRFCKRRRQKVGDNAVDFCNTLDFGERVRIEAHNLVKTQLCEILRSVSDFFAWEIESRLNIEFQNVLRCRRLFDLVVTHCDEVFQLQQKRVNKAVFVDFKGFLFGDIEDF